MRHQYFGRPENPTIEYFTPYGTTLNIMKPHIWMLARKGLHVHAYEYDKAIINSGNPDILPNTIDSIQPLVERDINTLDVRGIYGASLGAFIGFNILRRTEIDRMIMNTGCVSAVETLWTCPKLAEEKQAYIDAGYTKKDLADRWQNIDNDEPPVGKSLILMASTDDDMFSFDYVRRYYTALAPNCSEAEMITSKRLSHRGAVMRNICRVSMAAEFYGR